MGKQVHYVVCIDLVLGTWWIDDDTTNANFDAGRFTWNDDTQEWEETTWEEAQQAITILNSGRKAN